MNSVQLSVEKRTITTSSQGIIVASSVDADTLTATFDSEWSGLTTIACFEGSGCKVEVEYEAGMEIPWECIQREGSLDVAFEGFNSSGTLVLRTRRMKYPLYVVDHGPMEGEEEQEATRSVVAQCLDATAAANTAASTANTAAARAEAAATAKFPIFSFTAPDIYVVVPEGGNYTFSIDGDGILEVNAA